MASQLNVRIPEETRRLLEMAAACESRSLGAVLDDAVRMYVRSRSDDYRKYIDLAHQFLHAPAGSDEREHARAGLASGIAAELGMPTEPRGGDVRVVRTRLRQRRTLR